MHTTRGRAGTIFLHNGGYDGDVIIQTNQMTADGEAIVPMADILQLVADHVRSQRIARLEDASPEEILALKQEQLDALVQHAQLGKGMGYVQIHLTDLAKLFGVDLNYETGALTIKPKTPA